MRVKLAPFLNKRKRFRVLFNLLDTLLPVNLLDMGGASGEEDSHDSGSGEDNRERILQDEIVELERRIAKLERSMRWAKLLFWILFTAFFALLLVGSAFQ